MAWKLNRLLAVGLMAALSAQAEDVIKIGHVAPVSGGQAHLGKDNELGARMAIAKLNASGFKINGKAVKFELVAEDDAADPKQGTAAAQKLIDAKVNGVIGHLNSGTTIPASRLYNQAGIPQVSPSATNPEYTRQGFKTAFRLVADDAKLGGTLGTYAVKKLQGKSIVIVDDRTAYGKGVAEEFRKAVEAAGGKVLKHEFTTDEAADFTAILTTLRGVKPDVLFYGGMDTQAGPLINQARQLGIKATVMGGDGICTEKLPELARGSVTDGSVVCAEAGGAEGEFKTAQEAFRAEFKKVNGVEVQIYAPYVYDAVMVMADAMKRAKSADPKVYLPELAKTANYKGLTGMLSFDAKGDLKQPSLSVYTYKGGHRSLSEVVH
ncbi:MAG: branched-chain amino acid ABC transporter substrate-binding protein [Burkholderiaceae bacterium]|nr:MAG: branched-chain amino acid ABC transporter substrate-binding protein [Burkholderiaceae bacterium]